MSDAIIPADVPGLGTVHFVRTPDSPVGDGGIVVLWPDGTDLDEGDTRTARFYWDHHPELH